MSCRRWEIFTTYTNLNQQPIDGSFGKKKIEFHDLFLFLFLASIAVFISTSRWHEYTIW